MQIQSATPESFSEILRLNEEALPHVNQISIAELSELASQACFFKIATSEESVAGFLLALAEGESYHSLNYRWFSEQFESFVYVDRIIVNSSYQGQGIGKRLYQDLEASVRERTDVLTCEVNLEPPNPHSFAFHQHLGFREVGQQRTEGGSKRVSLLVKHLNASDKSDAIAKSES